LCGNRGAGSGGDLTTDAWIAAIPLAHGASVLTLDSDFARFPGVRWGSRSQPERTLDSSRSPRITGEGFYS